MLKRIPWFEIILAVAIMGITLYGAFSDAQNFPRNWFDRDDAYYYFKVAQNISEGRGSTFDGVNPTNGYHPLWMLICVPIFALARFDLILPLRVLFVAMGTLSVMTSILLYRFLRRVMTPGLAALAAIYWATDYTIQLYFYQPGLETGIAALCIIALLYTLTKYEEAWKERPAAQKEIVILAVLATLVMFSRLDLIFLAILIGFRVVFRNSALRDLLGLDLLFIITSVLTSFIIRIGLPEYYIYSNAAEAMIVISVILRLPIFYFFGIYNPAQRPFDLLWKSLLAVTLSSVILTAVMIPIASLMHFDVFPRTALLYDFGLMLFMTVSSRLGAHWFSKTQAREERSPIQILKASWKNWLSNGAVYYGIVIGALGLYMLINLIMFQTASPISGQIKRWWGSHSSLVYGGAARYKLDFYGISPETDFNAWPPLTWRVYDISGRISLYAYWNTWWHYKYSATFIGVIVLGLIVFAINRAYSAHNVPKLVLLPLIAASGIQFLSYNIGGYAAMKEWYWVTQFFAFTITAYLLMDMFTRHIVSIKSGAVLMWLIASAIGLLRVTGYASYIKATMPYNYYAADTPYMDAVPFIESHTEPGSLIGMTGGGNAGYFIRDRSIINMDGLINSYDYFKALQSGKAADYLADNGMDYIFANPNLLEGAPYRGQFTGKYQMIDRFGGKVIMKFTP
ncbi:MAG: hypothetical protein MUO77_04250 [Anaerolineales bacterium]|nr:hypothetical protein [Anaerolineales bacterium]